MDGNAHLVARLSRKLDARGEGIEIYAWESHKTLHGALLERVQHSSLEPSGTVRMSPDDVAWLRDWLQRSDPGLSPAECGLTLDALDAAVEDAAEDPSLVFEYTWATDFV